MELGKPLIPVQRADREMDVICPICFKVLHLMPGDVIPHGSDGIASIPQEKIGFWKALEARKASRAFGCRGGKSGALD